MPDHADDLGERAVVALDLRGDVLGADEGRAEEDEGVGRAGDVLRGAAVYGVTGVQRVVSRRLMGASTARPSKTSSVAWRRVQAR